MQEIMIYLKELFGPLLKINENTNMNEFPMYMVERYQFVFIEIEQRPYVLVNEYKKQDLNINQLKKQMSQIYDYSKSFPIFVFESLRLSQRNVLLQNHIPFIQTHYQIYIPNVMIDLKHKELFNKEYAETFSIAAQVTYIYILLNHVTETNAPRLAMEIPYSKITLNRALAELVSRKLLYTQGGATRKIYKTINRKELWEKGKQFLFNPVEKKYYCRLEDNKQDLFISNEYALSILGNEIVEPSIKTYAVSNEQLKNINEKDFLNKYDLYTDDYMILEQFKYNPAFVSKSDTIDIISLYAQLKDDDDQRIQIALEELMEEKLNV